MGFIPALDVNGSVIVESVRTNRQALCFHSANNGCELTFYFILPPGGNTGVFRRSLSAEAHSPEGSSSTSTGKLNF